MEDQQQEKNTTFAVFEFEWELINVQKKTGTYISKMIEFRGEKLFRAGLKNQSAVSYPYSQASSSTLVLMTTDLAKMGLRASTVFYSDMERRRVMQKMVIKEAADNSDGKVQLFTAQLGSFATGKEIYKFHVYISGVVEGYQFRQKDSLINEQLWLSAQNEVGTDFKIMVGKKILPVHKFILAARSPVFSAQFNDEKKDKIYFDADPTCMERFLKFLYTGELEGAVNNPKLKELASTYQIKILESICGAASKEMNEDQMVNFVLKCESLVKTLGNRSLEINQSNSIVHHSSAEAVLNYEWKWGKWISYRPNKVSAKAFEYKNEGLFRARLVTKSISTNQSVMLTTLLSHHRHDCGFKIQQVACSNKQSQHNWVKLTQELVQNENKLQMFYNEDMRYSEEDPPTCLNFHVQVVNTTPNYDFKFVDVSWGEQIWSAAVAKKFTDVEFLVGDQSFAAHRFVLSVRSPVFAAMFNSGMAEAKTGRVRINDDIDPEIFRSFLEFLYVGDLKSFKGKKQLFVLADKYEVETLMALCKPTTEKPMDADDFTKALLAY